MLDSKSHKLLALCFLLFITIAHAQIYSVPLRDPIEYDDNTEVTLFNLASSVIWSINEASLNSGWLRSVLSDFDYFNSEDEQLLTLPTFLQEKLGASSIKTVEGVDALDDAKTFFEENAMGLQGYDINLGLTYSAQMRANDITRQSYMEQKAPVKSNSAAQKYLDNGKPSIKTNNFEEFIIYSCGTYLEESFGSILWQLFTSDGDSKRDMRDSIFSKSFGEIGVGIAGLQNPMTLINGEDRSIGSTVIVIHVASSCECSSNQCPDIAYPAKSFSDLQVDFETTQNHRWTNYWKEIKENHFTKNIALAGVSLSWSFTLERLDFKVTYEGPTFAPINGLFRGNVDWLLIDYANSNKDRGHEYFKTNIWNSKTKRPEGWFIEMNSIADMKYLLVDIKYQESGASINSGHGSVRIILENSVTPNLVNCKTDVDCDSMTPNISSHSISECLRESGSCDALLMENKEGYSFYQVMLMYTLINKYREDPANFDSLYQLEFVGSNKARVQLGHKQVSFDVLQGQDFYEKALEKIQSNKPKRRFTISYALSVSAQFRANVISKEDDRIFDDLYMNKVTFNQVLKYLNMTVDNLDHTEIKIRTCNFELVENIVQTPYLLFSEEQSNQQYLKDLDTKSFSHIGIGVATSIYSTERRCHPQVLVIHLSKSAECALEGCPVKMPDLPYVDHTPYWNEMFQKLIRQHNKNEFVTMNLVSELTVQKETGKAVIRVESVMMTSPGFDLDWDQGRFNWTFHSVIRKNTAKGTDMQFYQQYLKPQLGDFDLSRHKHIDIDHYQLQDIFSFEVYCTWVNSEGIFASAIKPIRIELNKHGELTRVAPVIIRDSPEESPYYFNLKLRGKSPYPNGNIYWKGTSLFSPPMFLNEYTLDTLYMKTDKAIQIQAGSFYKNESDKQIGSFTVYTIQSVHKTEPTFDFDTKRQEFQWKSVLLQPDPTIQAYVTLTTSELSSQFYLQWQNYYSADQGSAKADYPYIAETVTGYGYYSLNKYPEFQKRAKFSIASSETKPSQMPTIDPYVRDMNLLSKQVGSLVNYLYKLRRDNGGKEVGPVSFQIYTRDCINGKPVLFEHPLAWNIQKFKCNCTEGWSGMFCDLKDQQIEDFRSQIDNFFAAIDGLPHNQDTIPKVYEIFEKLSKIMAMMGVLTGGSAGKFIQAMEMIENSDQYTYSIRDIENAMETVINLWRAPFLLHDESRTFHHKTVGFLERYIQFGLDVSQFNSFDSHYEFKGLRFKMAYTYVNPLTALQQSQIGISQIDLGNLEYDGYTTGWRKRFDLPYNRTTYYVNPEHMSRQLQQPIAVFLEFPKEIFYPFKGFELIATYVYYLAYYDQITRDTYDAENFIIEITKFNAKWYAPKNSTFKCIMMAEDSFTTDYCSTEVSEEVVVCTCNRPGFVSYTVEIDHMIAHDPNLEFDQDDEGLGIFEMMVRVLIIAGIGYLGYWLYRRYQERKKNHKYSAIDTKKNRIDFSEYELSRVGDADDDDAALRRYDAIDG